MVGNLAGPERSGGRRGSDRGAGGARDPVTGPSDDTVKAGSPWRLRNWRVRRKLIVVLLIPVLVGLALAGLRGWYELDRKASYDEAVASMNTMGDVVGLMHELQKERAQVVTFVAAGRAGDMAPLQPQFRATNAAVDRLATFNQENPSSGIANRLTAIEAIRTAATSSRYPDVAVYTAYTSVLDALILGTPNFTAGLVDTELSDRATALLAVVEAKEYLARQTAILLIAAEHDEFPASMLDQARAAEARHIAAVTTFRANASTEGAQLYADTVSGPEIDERERIKSTAFSRADQNVPLAINAPQLAADGTVVVDSMQVVENNLLNTLRGLARDTASSATATAVRDASIVLAALLLALLVAFVVARSLLRPLRLLRRDVLDVAHHRLPATVQRILADPDPVSASRHAVDPVPVFTNEETGQLARSFDAVQEQAVRMATEQALLRDNINSIFVNLSRRSQALVERQLSLIDRLEQDEQDPDQLASLFELDHLATRMRRNSESLLVLSGSGLSRQLNRPVPATDVVGAAVSEVEHYARIEVAAGPEVAVQGRAVSDLVHVIAELLDNATSFSEPEKKVIVRLRMTRTNELVIQITDRGVGMSEEEIEAANARLADPPDLDVAVTRRMGLYVVARLAKRHNIVVRLRDNEDIEGGLIARINVPADLVQPIGAEPTSTSAVSASLPATTGTSAPRNSGIAGAFTGNMPRLRPDGRVVGEPRQDRPTREVPSYPPPAPEPVSQNGGQHGPDQVALFGNHLPDPGESGPAEHEGHDTAAADPAHDYAGHDPNMDAPTERLPIYEAVLSQWFEAGDTGSMNRHAVGQPTEAGSGVDAGGDNGTGNGTGNGAYPGSPEEPVAAPEPTPWTSPGDDGWLAAQALLENSTPDTTTNAGLPKRVPKAHLVPGSAGPRHRAAEEGVQEAPEPPPLPPRTAEAVRGRMSSFQQGVRRGRHALIDAYAGDQSGSEQSRRNEEQE